MATESIQIQRNKKAVDVLGEGLPNFNVGLRMSVEVTLKVQQLEKSFEAASQKRKNNTLSKNKSEDNEKVAAEAVEEMKRIKAEMEQLWVEIVRGDGGPAPKVQRTMAPDLGASGSDASGDLQISYPSGASGAHSKPFQIVQPNTTLNVSATPPARSRNVQREGQRQKTLGDHGAGGTTPGTTENDAKGETKDNVRQPKQPRRPQTTKGSARH